MVNVCLHDLVSVAKEVCIVFNYKRLDAGWQLCVILLFRQVCRRWRLHGSAQVGRVAVSTGENLGCSIWKERNRMAGEDDCQSADGRSPCRLCLLASEFQTGVCNLITMSCMRTMLPLWGTYSLSKAYYLNCHGSLQTGDNLYIPVPHAATCPKCLVK